MKLMTAILTVIMLTTTPGLASSGQETAGTGLLVLLFIGFGMLIVICQLIPSLILFSSMIKGLYHSAAQDIMPKTGANQA